MAAFFVFNPRQPGLFKISADVLATSGIQNPGIASHFSVTFIIRPFFHIDFGLTE
jgi:hypothetical protein